MSTIIEDDGGMPDMKALHRLNPLIPDPTRLEKRVIPLEDIAGWLLPFELVFGIVYWDTMGLQILTAFVFTILVGYVIPTQARLSKLAKTEFLKERTQLRQLEWEEQCEIIQFEKILEPSYRLNEDRKDVILDEEGDPVADELDIDEWVTGMDMEGKLFEDDDGMMMPIHTLDSRYVANLFRRMEHIRKNEATDGSFSHDKIGWISRLTKTGATFTANAVKKYAPMIGGSMKRGAVRASSGARGGAKGFGNWLGRYKRRFAAAFIIGFLTILFSNWILYYLKIMLAWIGWTL